MSWSYHSFDGDRLKFNLVFEAPLNVSLNQPDIIVFGSPYADFIFKPLGNKRNLTTFEAKMKCPKQMIRSVASATMIETSKDSVVVI